MQKKLPIAQTIWKHMRLTLCQIALSVAGIACCYANESSGQELLHKKVTIKAEQIHLSDALESIESKARIRFLYSYEMIGADRRVSLNAEREELMLVLDRLLRPLGISYEVSREKVIVLRRTSLPVAISPDANPEMIVNGTVRDENGDPLPGVNVVIKGTTTGTTTDSNGSYSITIEDGEQTLVFSFVGYNQTEVKVGTQKRIDVTLAPDITTLSEIVVTGYGTQRKVETTGAIASVKSSEITQTPVANIAQGIQARVPGVQITQNSAAPGGNVSVRVRGTNSINGTSEPLYIIDGVQVSNGGGINEVSPLSTINPNDIESIEVLKDASSTSIYGARGANGVVLITTKRGKAGASRVTFDSYYGIQQVTRKLDVMNSRQFGELENDIYRPTVVYGQLDTLTSTTDWQDLVFRDAPIQSYQLSLSGGSEKTQYMLSGNYFDQQGVMISSQFKRYSLRTNIDHTLNDRFRTGLSILASHSVNDVAPNGGTSTDGASIATGSLLGAAIVAPPTLLPYRPDGTVWPFGDQFGGRYREVTNPMGLAEIKNQTMINRFLSSIYVDASIVKNLTYRATFSADIQSSLQDVYSPRSIIPIGNQNLTSGSGTKRNDDRSLLLHESILTYSLKLLNDHTFKITGVFSTQKENYRYFAATGTGFPNDETANERLQLSNAQRAEGFRNSSRLDSYMARMNYGYRDKLFVDLTARADGSSRFGANNKYGFFPAIGAAYRLSEEAFLSESQVISDFKIRASYGTTGNAGAIEPYQSLQRLGAGANYQFNNSSTPVIGISPTAIANPDLSWEKSTQFNLGVDINLLNDRLSFTADVYSKETKDLLYERQLPVSSGYGSVISNLGGIKNEGIEFALNSVVLDKGVRWDVSANISFNRNEVISIDGNQTEIFGNQYSIIKVGQPIGLFKTYVFDGIYQSGETLLKGAGDNRVGGTKLLDINGDGTVDGQDQVITGNPNPDFIFGFSSNLQYKNFDFSLFASGTYGNEVYNTSRLSIENPLGQRNLLATMVNRWSNDNPSNEYPSGRQGGRLPISNRFIEDGSFLRLRNITFGYSLPGIKGISKARIYVSANNLFTLANYSGFDPEVNSGGGSNVTLGVDNVVYPVAKSFLAGLQVTF